MRQMEIARIIVESFASNVINIEKT